MVPELAALYSDLNLGKLRIARPTKFIFICGGTIQPEGAGPKPTCLRDYLYRVRPIGRRVQADIVLAEAATQLYRDTGYKDLISFEEDIARIAAVVLVIAESPGSLAELGAFSSNDVIRSNLRVVIQENYAHTESFVRHGPVTRILNDKEDRVGVFPWETRQSGSLIQNTVAPHYNEIIKFINYHINAVPKTETLPQSQDVRLFYIIYWVIYLAFAISTNNLLSCVKLIIPNITQTDMRNKIYCMELAGWISSQHYSGKYYFFVRRDLDPFDYAFNELVVDRDSTRRKALVSAALKKFENAPKYIRLAAADKRGQNE